MWHQNIVRFSEEFKGIYWDNVVDKQNAHEAYSAFHEIITESIIFASLSKSVKKDITIKNMVNKCFKTIN